MRKILVLFLTLTLATATLANPPAPREYYDALKDGLSVEDLEKVSSLDAEQKKIAGEILDFYLKGPETAWTQCTSNLKNHGTATEMWFTDHDQFPDSQKPISPSYLLISLSCPTTNNKPYTYALKDGVYFFQCPGDHSLAGVDPPTYNGESGLSTAEPNLPGWKLVSYNVEDPVDGYATCSRIGESWAWGEETRDFRSQVELPATGMAAVARCWNLTDQDISTVNSATVLKLMDANFRQDSLVSDESLLETLWELSPAVVGIVIVEYVKNPELAESRRRLLETLNQEG